MSDNLYERDILEWSERQAELLRRLAAREQNAGVDWSHVIDEIKAVGEAQLNDVRGLVRQAMICLLRIHLNGDDPARTDWDVELACLHDDLAEQFTPSMRQRINLTLIWDRVRARSVRQWPGNPRARALPDHCPWTIDALLANDTDALLAALAGWPVDRGP